LIKRVKIILKKITSFLREKGIIITFIKIFDYLIFKKAEKKKKKVVPILIFKDDITVVTNSNGIDLIVGKNFITNNCGFHSAVKNLEKWHDSTQAEFRFKREGDSLIVKERWWNLPLKCNWVFTLKKRSVIWKVTLIVENHIVIEEIKSGLIINNIYDSLILDKKRLDLPWDNFQWQEMFKIKRKTPLTISIKDSLLNFPDLKFKIIDSLYLSKTIVQNTDDHLNGRLLQAIMEGEVEYRPGEYRLFELEISIIKK